jgi:hypothetical protein
MSWLKKITWTRNRVIVAVSIGALAVLGIGYEAGDRKPPRTIVAQQQQPEPMDESENGLPPAALAEVQVATVGALVFTFFHETGHMLISELKLPVTGPEEDSADEFATYLLTDALREVPDDQPEIKDMMVNIIYAGANFWRLTAVINRERNGDSQNSINWSDEHSPDMKRYFNVVCIAAGADPAHFAKLVSDEKIDRCVRDYKRKYEAWNRLIAPYRKNAVQRLLHLGGRMQMQIGPAGKNAYLVYEKKIYEQGGGFQQILDQISGNIMLPNDVPVVPKGCNGTINAFWDPQGKSITLCHEMTALIVQTFAAAEKAKLAQAGQTQDGGETQPPPAPQQTPTAGGNRQNGLPVAGNWNCVSHDGSFTQIVALGVDGSLKILNRLQNGFAFNVWGSWLLRGSNLYYRIAGYNPRQLCGSNGCQPLNFPSSLSVQIEMPDQDTIEDDEGTCRRTG